MLEKDIEAHLRDKVKDADGIAFKFTSPQRRSVPDRLILMPVAEEHMDIVARYVRFVEVKNTGKKATDAQLREHARLRALGFRVQVIDNKPDAARVPVEMELGL